ncbi:hypothetical protein [Methanogenium cariaci]|nr:hypothetical protein [Methanogenium cariaci]
MTHTFIILTNIGINQFRLEWWGGSSFSAELFGMDGSTRVQA